ncbi:MAG: PH domain-containing protein [Nocardiopsaceae bacterium]|nr:PH domain-containing protein [Nocardiopsaceae bacterium]
MTGTTETTGPVQTGARTPADPGATDTAGAAGGAPPDHLATAEPWRRLSPLTMRMSAAAATALIGAPALIGAAITAFIGVFAPWGGLILLAGALLIAALVGYAVLRYRLTRYRVSDGRMEMYSGIVSRNHSSLPRDRIRSVDVAAPLWARPFGLRRVTVGTGEDADTDDQLTLAMVTVEEADRLRGTLLDRAPFGASSGAAADSAALLASMRPAWFEYGALSGGPLAVGYGVLAAVIGGAAQFGGTFYAQLAPELYDQVMRHLVVSVATAGLGAIAFGTFIALAVHTEAWWGYRLTREPNGTLLVKRGLLNLSSVSIEEKRLRGVELREYLPLRWFGAASVAAVASGLGEEDHKSGLVPKRALSPELPRAEAVRVAGAALRGPGFPELAAHPRAALRRRLVRAAAAVPIVAAAAGTAAWFVPPVSAAGAVLIAAAAGVLTALVAVPYAVGCYRGLGHGISGDFLYLRRGMAARSTVALKRGAIIGWTVRRSPFQRRAGLSTLGAMVAAGGGLHRAPDIGHGRGLALADEAVPDLLAPFLVRS